jgi:hypothetical protein
MTPGDAVSMQHPDGYATITGGGGTFVGWVPNGIIGMVYLLTPDESSAVVQFDGKLIATVPVRHLKLERRASAPAA